MSQQKNSLKAWMISMTMWDWRRLLLVVKQLRLDNEKELSRALVSSGWRRKNWGETNVLTSYVEAKALRKAKLQCCAKQSKSYAKQNYNVAQSKIKIAQSKIKIAQSKVKIAHSKIKVARSKIKVAQGKIKIAQSKIKIAESKTIVLQSKIEIACAKQNKNCAKQNKRYALCAKFLYY